MLREDEYFEDTSSDITAISPASWDVDTTPDYFARGLKFCLGRGVEPDLIQAHKWFNIAALRGNREARHYRSEVAAEMTRREIAEAQRQAREWVSRH